MILQRQQRSDSRRSYPPGANQARCPPTQTREQGGFVEQVAYCSASPTVSHQPSQLRMLKASRKSLALTNRFMRQQLQCQSVLARILAHSRGVNCLKQQIGGNRTGKSATPSGSDHRERAPVRKQTVAAKPSKALEPPKNELYASQGGLTNA